MHLFKLGKKHTNTHTTQNFTLLQDFTSAVIKYTLLIARVDISVKTNLYQ